MRRLVFVLALGLLLSARSLTAWLARGRDAGPPDCGAALGRLAPGTAWASHGPGGLLMHSPRLVLVDRDARIRAYHRPDDPASVEALRSNLRRLLAGPAP